MIDVFPAPRKPVNTVMGMGAGFRSEGIDIVSLTQSGSVL